MRKGVKEENATNVLRVYKKSTNSKISKTSVQNQRKTENDKTVEFFRNEKERIGILRNRAKRIIGLVKNKFNLETFRSNNKNGYRSGNIHNPDTKNYWMSFSTQETTSKVEMFLREQGYTTYPASDRRILIDITSTPEDNKTKSAEEKDTINHLEHVTSQLKETVEKARTQHLTSEQIGGRLWEYMKEQNIILIDGNKKVRFDDFFSGKNQSDWDKESFTTLIVNEALK